MRNSVHIHGCRAPHARGGSFAWVIATLAITLCAPTAGAWSAELNSDDLQRVDQLANHVSTAKNRACSDPPIILDLYEEVWQLQWDIEIKQFSVPGKTMTRDERAPFEEALQKVDGSLTETATIVPCIFRSK